MANLDSMLNSRDITLPTKVHLVKVMVLPVVMYGCASWTIKKAECQRIDAFELWYWRRPLDYKEIKPVNLEYSLEGLMLKLKLPILWPLDSKSLFIRKDPDVGKD